jgi:hypothetical protein
MDDDGLTGDDPVAMPGSPTLKYGDLASTGVSPPAELADLSSTW